jgi:PleD family two-component response regulator
MYSADSDTVSPPALILIASDQEWAALSLESILSQSNYAVVRSYTGRQTLALAGSANPDAIIIEARLPDISGLEVCRLLREDRRIGATTPIIVTTTDVVERGQLRAAYEAGAWDLVGQPLDGDALMLKLRNFVRAKQELDVVRGDSLVDELTGLYNMRGLARRAREIGAEAHRTRSSLACVVFAPEVEDGPADLGGTGLNDSLDITTAQQLGAVCRRSGRASDALGRLGPCEFGVVALATGPDGAQRLAERLQHAMEAAGRGSARSGITQLTPTPSNRSLRVRAGYCAVSDYAASDVDAVEMLLRATRALRDASREGSLDGRIRVFDIAGSSSISSPPLLR